MEIELLSLAAGLNLNDVRACLYLYFDSVVTQVLMGVSSKVLSFAHTVTILESSY